MSNITLLLIKTGYETNAICQIFHNARYIKLIESD